MSALPTTSGAPEFHRREFHFTPKDFRRIADILYTEVGISLSDAKAPLVYSRLVKRLRTLGLENFSHYCQLVDSPEGVEERGHMMAALTTTVTRFFREPHHFEHLKTTVLPPLLDEVRAGRPLRIWSAGCSSGEEPYSVALTLLELMPEAAEFDVRILATDINPQVLARGRRGIYREACLAPLTRQMRADWFTQIRMGDGERAWAVGEALSRLVTFRELNLMRPWPMRAAYQAIFCRNVMIYFEPETRAETVDRMADLLAPDGRLYLGHSERTGDARGLLALEAATTYRRVGASPT